MVVFDNSNAKVMPPIPLISSAAENMFYGLNFHPSFAGTHRILDEIMGTSDIPALEFHEVDGAQSNVRLNSHMLSLPQFRGGQGGMFFDHSRCQNHATHLITVCMLSLAGCNLLSKLYQLAAFLGNLGYVLRLQMAVVDWLQQTLVIKPLETRQPDPLMEEICDYIHHWHKHGNLSTSDGPAPKADTAFQKKLAAFKEMWNGCACGDPVHYCDCGSSSNSHCLSRDDAIKKMANSLVALLLTSCPAPPTPNKWTKLWKPLDFAGIGVFRTCFRQIFLFGFLMIICGK